MWYTCSNCGTQVYLEGENIGKGVSYTGICSKCGKLIIKDDCGKKKK